MTIKKAILYLYCIFIYKLYIYCIFIQYSLIRPSHQSCRYTLITVEPRRSCISMFGDGFWPNSKKHVIIRPVFCIFGNTCRVHLSRLCINYSACLSYWLIAVYSTTNERLDQTSRIILERNITDGLHISYRICKLRGEFS